jgi:hypothetical protein
MLDLLHPIYKETAAYGHFGREHFPWEKTDKADAAARSRRPEIILQPVKSGASTVLALFFGSSSSYSLNLFFPTR